MTSGTPILERLHGFVLALRQAGVRIAPSEAQDGLQALTVLGATAFVDATTTAAVLRTTLVKRTDDLLVFHRVFAAFFLARADPNTGDDLVMLSQDAVELANALAIADALLLHDAAGHPFRIAAALEAVPWQRLSSPLQVGLLTESAAAALGLSAAEGVLFQAIGTIDPERQRALQELIDHARRLRLSLRRRVSDEVQTRMLGNRMALRQTASLLDRPFGVLSASDRVALRALLARLLRVWKSRVQRRRPPGRRGRLDVRRTVAGSVLTDGVPVRLRYRKRRPLPRPLVVLCDISDSVRVASWLTLEIAHALQRVERRARSFVFVDRTAEITALFARHRVDDALHEVSRGTVVPLFTRSDYGRALNELDALTRDVSARATVLVLGDGRTNHGPSGVEALAALRRRTRQLVWLCPEPRSMWGVGDSVMPAYAAVADQAFVVSTLRDLSQVIDRLVR